MRYRDGLGRRWGRARQAARILLSCLALAACGRPAPEPAAPAPTASVVQLACDPQALGGEARATAAPAATTAATPIAPPAAPTAASTATSPPPAATSAVTPSQSVTPSAAPTVQPALSADGSRLTLPLAEEETLGAFAVSPDRSGVVFAVASYRNPGVKLFSVALGGGVPQELAVLRGVVGSIQFTPDGRTLLLDCRGKLLMLPVEGGEPKQLATGLGAAGDPGPETGETSRHTTNMQVPNFLLSPSGDRVAYRTPEALYLMALGGPALRLSDPTPPESYIYGYQFSPDGRWLVYDERRYDLWDEPKTPSWGSGLIKIQAIYSVPIVGGRPILLASAPTEDGAIYHHYTLGPGGSELLYTTFTTDGETTAAEELSWRVPLAGGAATALAELPPLTPTPTVGTIAPLGVPLLAWPDWPMEPYQIQPELSSLTQEGLTLELVNLDNPQDYVVITSTPGDPAADLAACTEQATVRNVSASSCTTGAGTTLIWNVEGWTYSLGGGLLSTERAVALAEGLTLVDAPTAQRRLSESLTP